MGWCIILLVSMNGQDGQCSHGPLTSTEQDKTYLPKTSKAAEAIRKVVFGQKWLKSMVYYFNFR